MNDTSRTLGIIGGGQLGRMLAEAARKLGIKTIILDPTPNSPAGQLADEQIVGSFKDAEFVRMVGKRSDVLTFETELANAEALEELEKEGKPVYPSPGVLKIIKDKFNQKVFLTEAGIPVAESVEIQTIEDVSFVADRFGYPFLLKARFDAYDGRGNRTIRSKEDIEKAFSELSKGSSLYAERFVPFEKELAVVGVRTTSGEVKTYPVVETVHKNHICHTVFAPAQISQDVAEKARTFGEEVLEHLSGAGVFAIEMFMTHDGSLFVNEIAPRVHNSGHFSIEGSVTSQFENHVRAVMGMPLGDTHMARPYAVMVNILGDRNGEAQPTGVSEAEALGEVGVHIYGKIETREERKMGHLTAIGETFEETRTKALQASDLIHI